MKSFNMDHSQDVELPFVALHDLGCGILQKCGASQKIASQVVDELIRNEVSGYDSHGILRLIEYVQLINQGHTIPSNQPTVKQTNKFVSEVDGQKCFGILSSDAAAKALLDHLERDQLGFVVLTNSGHIGRLWPIASSVCKRGGILIGFSNLSGAGQNVLPFGGNEGRLCTNPIVIGVPSEPPIILDMSTSAVSEGKLRKLWLRGEKAPKGWLFDKNWKTVCDPRRFYKKPKTAFLGPLGGMEFGYKGFGLALMVEIFAGILTGGGYSQHTGSKINNNALFITFHPDLLGQSLNQFRERVDDLLKYLESSSSSKELHIPGQATGSYLKTIDEKRPIRVSFRLYQELQDLAGS
jgi:LDH2 family malate/lactate/ureidoglycolate dehydrogenase